MYVVLRFGILFLLIASLRLKDQQQTYQQADDQFIEHPVEPGDSWTALVWRFGLSEEELRSNNPHPNSQRLPAVGAFIAIPRGAADEGRGRIWRSNDGGLMQTAVRSGDNTWKLALTNQVDHPYTPLLFRPIFSPDSGLTPKELPANFTKLELSSIPSYPGRAVGLRATAKAGEAISITLGSQQMTFMREGDHIIALGGTGAFFQTGDHELTIEQENAPLWSQPWRFEEDSWTFEEIYLTGDAAAISQEMIIQERDRLNALWSVKSPSPLWSGSFHLPLNEFLAFSSLYGARRSYNGGPYRSYHEGLDFSAYAGTPVYAPAEGQVVLAEFLDVRGGAVIIDHGLGLYSGFYHMSEIEVSPGDQITTGHEIGKVGSTGLSTGSHLHFDLLINNTWIDPQNWIDSNLDCWLLEGIGQPCQ